MGGEGEGEFVPFGDEGCMARNWKLHWNASALLSGVVNFFLWWFWKEPFSMAPQREVSKCLELYVRGRIYCLFNKFLILLGINRGQKVCEVSTEITTVEARFFEPSSFRPPDNAKRKSFPSPQSNTVILVTPDFSKYLIFWTNVRFPPKFEKFGFNCGFGMITRSLDLRIGSVFVFTAIWVRLYNSCFRALWFFWGGQ